MKTLQYILIFIAGCCFAGVGIGLLIIVFGLNQSRIATNLPQPLTQSNASIEPTSAPLVVLPTTAPTAVPTAAIPDTPTAIPTPTPSPTDTPLPTPTALPAQSAPPALATATAIKIVTANRNTELYQGPGTNFAVIGSIAAGQSLSLIGMSFDGQWYQLADGGWIGAYVVDSLLSAEIAPVAAPASVQAEQVAAVTLMPLPAGTSQPAPTALPEASPIPTVASIVTHDPLQVTGPTYQQVCNVDESSMTDPQIAAFANKYVGQTFTGWQTWVYDVVDRANGAYDLQLSIEERGFLWARDIVIENIPQELAFSLNVEQPLILSGRIARNEVFWEGVCNPLVVDNYVLHTPGVAQPIANYSSATTTGPTTVQAAAGEVPSSPTLTVLSHTIYESSGSRYIIGEVQNLSTYPVKWVEVVAVLRDSNGSVVNTGSSYATLDTIPANGKSPFSIGISSWDGVSYYDLAVEGSAGDLPRQDLIILNHGSSVEDSSLRVFGEVQNTGTAPAESVKVVITLYNSSGQVVGLGSAYTTLDAIQAGSTSAFSTSISHWEDYSYYEIQVQG